MEDKVFGTLTFNVGWTKKCNIVWWNKEISVDIRVSCYQTEEPNEKQEEAYMAFNTNIKSLSIQTEPIVMNYVKGQNGCIENPIWNYITINEVLFFQNGNYAIICSPINSPEEDIVILISGSEIKIGGGFLIEFQL